MSSEETTPPEVTRWEALGGAWRIAQVAPGHVEVDLLQCDGGQIADRITLTGPENTAWALAAPVNKPGS
ncbi:hypothetical protein [Actinomyces minihominis]|uniref:hypothetical protein n=1 Tax=Actinomyces minihominis TaxID=2002838 RepID=UPI000C06ADBB|nr:hypothetical protein [Actinomyces minihominis]